MMRREKHPAPLLTKEEARFRLRPPQPADDVAIALAGPAIAPQPVEPTALQPNLAVRSPRSSILFSKLMEPNGKVRTIASNAAWLMAMRIMRSGPPPPKRHPVLFGQVFGRK
jgi:hypothetical protein